MKLVILVFIVAMMQTIMVRGQIKWQTGGGGVQWAQACDFKNRDLSSAQVSSEKCGDKCLSTSGCTHFSWTNYQVGTCWMKTGGAQKSDAIANTNKGMICGISSSSTPGINWQTGAGGVQWAQSCDFKNQDLSSAQVSADKCGEKCMSTSGCTHFSWTNYQSGTCWMKKGGAQKSDAIANNNSGMLCGIVPSSPNPSPGKLNCVSYEPFSDPSYSSNVPQALTNTLRMVVAQGFKCIKTYYSQYYGNSIVEYAQKFNLKEVLGIRTSESFTDAEVSSAIANCLSRKDVLVAIYAGNENLPDSSKACSQSNGLAWL